jgi:hypothetical protein
MFIAVATLMKELTPRGRLPPEAAGDIGTPEQVASAALVSYLVSKEAQYVTGKD